MTVSTMAPFHEKIVPGLRMEKRNKSTGSFTKKTTAAMCSNPTTKTSLPEMRTFIQLETPPTSDSGDSSIDGDEYERLISPMSSNWSPRNCASQNAGAGWTRFFPELSTNFSLVSPIGTTVVKPAPTPGTLYPFSADDVGCSLVNTANTSNHSANGHSRNVSSETSQSTLLTTGSSALSLDDSASSCYSRRSSLTSLESEYTGFGYKSADAFSIASPVAAGVFDDTASVQKAPPGSIKKKLSIAEVRNINKPLPEEPPILLTPLSVRHKFPPPLELRERPTGTSNLAIQKRLENRSRHKPTLSQAAEDLEDALAKIASSHNSPRHSSESESLLDDFLSSPLQISRGKMDMIPSRPAPQPPTHSRRSVSPPSSISSDTSDRQKYEKPQEAKKTKKSGKSKMGFSLMVPGFGRKRDRLHLRSLSSSNLKADAKLPDTIREVEGLNLNDAEERDTVPELPGSPYNTTQRPSSWGSEREMRQKLPRLQTQAVEHPSQVHPMPTPSVSTTNSNGRSRQNSTGSGMTNVFENVFDEKIFVSTSKEQPQRRPSARYALPYQMGRIQLPGMIYELDGGPSVVLPSSKPVSLGSVPNDVPENVVLTIMENADSLDDLFNLAMINKNFYTIFKKKELDLIKKTVFKMSPPAWELREVSPPWNSEWQVLLDPDAPVPEYTPTVYLRRYAQDIYTLAQLKLLILTRCSTFLRPDTIRGLAGQDIERAAEVDNAFWRIWTFCRIFGCGKGRENDTVGQLDWLNGGIMAMTQQDPATISFSEPFGMNNVLFEPPPGFAQGNEGGLSQKQLYDMTEIWTCLNVLLQPIHDKRAEARNVGIFEDFVIANGDTKEEEKILEEWTLYVLTLGLSAALGLSSVGPINNAAEIFRQARSVGLTKWELSETGISRSSFLKEALAKAYRSREQSSPSSQQSMRLSDIWSSSASSRGSRPSSCSSSGDRANPEHRQRQYAFADELRNQRPRAPSSGPTSFSDERPISSYNFIMNRLEGLPQDHSTPMPPPPMPTAPLSQYETTNPTNVQNPYFVIQPVSPGYLQQVLDPVDRAIDMMVRELGFKEEDAKWALKITDTGEGIDVNAAVSMLYTEYRKREENQHSQNGRRPKRNSFLPPFMNRDNNNSNWKWA